MTRRRRLPARRARRVTQERRVTAEAEPVALQPVAEVALRPVALRPVALQPVALRPVVMAAPRPVAPPVLLQRVALAEAGEVERRVPPEPWAARLALRARRWTAEARVAWGARPERRGTAEPRA